MVGKRCSHQQEEKARQKTVRNLKAGFTIPKSQRPEVVEINKAEVAGSSPFFEPAPKLAVTANTVVQKLRSRSLRQQSA